MKLLVIGTGYVGLTTGLALAEKNNKISFLDIDSKKIELLKNKQSPFYEKGIHESIDSNFSNLNFTTDNSILNECDVMFITVPTPEKKDGSSDLQYVDDVIKSLEKERKTERKFLFIIKSTVPVGTNARIQEKLDKRNLNGEVASNPEFLSQGTALWDSLNPHRIVIGTQSKWAKDTLEDLFENFGSPILNMDLESAELVKYASNTFQALKVSFINEIANISESTGANVGDVASGMSYDPVIGKKFLRSGIGYGGSCFPKDTKSLHMQAKKNGVNSFITDAVIKTNETQVLKIAKEAMKKNKSIGMLGLTFKPGTDDTRESPAFYIAKELNKNEIIPIAYDPKGSDNFAKSFPDVKIKFANNALEVIKKSEAILLITEWEEFKSLTKKDFINKEVYDGRRIYDFAHYQIGRGYKK